MNAKETLQPSSLPTPAVWRALFLAQEPRLVEAIVKLTEAVARYEPNETYAPVEPRAFLVGGYVRDLLLEKHPKDADVEVYGIEPGQLHELVKSLFGQVDIVGQSFGILKVFLGDGYELDIAVPRRESKAGKGHKGFTIESDPAMSHREAARRRDFTVNAIALDPLTGLIHDPFDGILDLRDDVLRVVDAKTFVEDPLRVYRAVQMAARFNLTVEAKTLELLRAMVQRGDLDELTPERISDEWKKLLVRSKQPSLGLGLMLELGIIEKDYPELFALIGTPQEPEWHPEGNVWIHTNMVIDEAARLLRQPERGLTSAHDRLAVVLGALCHDLGKPLTTRVEDGRVRSKGHEEAGEFPARSFCGRLTFGQDITEMVVKITRDHLKTTRYYLMLEKGEINDAQYANILRRLLRRLGPTPTEVYLCVTEADKRGRGFADADILPYTEGEVFRDTVAKFDLLTQSKTTLVSGGELMQKFGLAPGPKLGELIHRAEEARDSGLVQTKDEALKLIATWL